MAGGLMTNESNSKYAKRVVFNFCEARPCVLPSAILSHEVERLSEEPDYMRVVATPEISSSGGVRRQFGRRHGKSKLTEHD